MSQTTSLCLNCGRPDSVVPLISLSYREEALQICPQCLPLLIHQPQRLVGKLAGAESLEPAEHHDH